ELIPEFVERKNGKRVEYLDPRLEPILKPTYGIMVYQEQVMQIAQVIGGYTLGGADLLRRAMGKKKPEEMAQQRDIFVAGAQKNGLPRGKATQLFDLMEKFAGYGFNKSHAAAYALIAYQTAYFKAHHPSAFMAANLSLVMDDTDKVRQFYVDALALGLEMLPPDVNASSYRFEPGDERRIRYGLGGIKGTGRAAIEAIVAARDKGPFIDLFDFCRRVDKRVVNRRAVEALIRAGAFDTVEPRRASLLASVGAALDHAEHADRAASQVSLFGEYGGDGGGAGPALISAREWTETERLIQEKASLGFYLSGHPYHAYAAELKQLIQQPLGALRPSPTSVRIAGVVAQLRTQTSRRGKMAFVILDDGKDQCEVAIFNETFDACRHILREDALLVAEVKVMQRTGDDGQMQSMRIVAESLHDLAGARRKWARSLKIACNGSSSAERLLELLTPFRSGASGAAAIIVKYQNRSSCGDIELGSDWRVNLDDRLLESLRERFSAENVQVVY
ncbi:MAG TPA: OB-fold nucleic acid binding domain-containing protein, partial [Casimicrobiaceae bacterium]|nr:OB-fold nucleic acid binding domain-containing protein [Casimicrobiaceae bacterium]